MKQDFNKVFKTPKYTGVTLSLLSMFVLAAMFVVWQTFPKNQKPTTNKQISVFCDTKLEVPVLNIISSFEKEFSCNINIEFLNADEINKIQSEPVDVFIFNESDLIRLAVTNSNHVSIIPFAFEKSSGSESQINIEPFSCLIKDDATQSQTAFALARYFSAPSRGQFFLAEAGFPGVDGDQWKLKPSISIMVENNFEKDLDEFTKVFSEREGVTFEISKKSLDDASATINLISKSKAKEYLPDLLIGFTQLGFGNSSFVKFGRDMENSCLVSDSSKFKKTAIRFREFLLSHS